MPKAPARTSSVRVSAEEEEEEKEEEEEGNDDHHHPAPAASVGRGTPRRMRRRSMGCSSLRTTVAVERAFDSSRNRFQ